MRILIKLSAFLAARTPWVVIAVAAVAFWQRTLFAWVHGTSQSIILGMIMLAMGMTLSREDLRILAERPFDILIGTVAQYTLMPLLAVGVTKTLNLPPAVSMGLALVATCPGGVSSNIMTYLCKGDVAFSVGMTTSSTLLAPIMTPFLMSLLADATIQVNALQMFISILLVTLLPVTLGYLLNRSFGSRPSYRNLVNIMPGVAVLGLSCVVGGVIATCGEQFLDCGLVVFIAVFTHNALGYLFGYLTGYCMHFTAAKNRTISIEVGMQNAGLATYQIVGL